MAGKLQSGLGRAAGLDVHTSLGSVISEATAAQHAQGLASAREKEFLILTFTQDV